MAIKKYKTSKRLYKKLSKRLAKRLTKRLSKSKKVSKSKRLHKYQKGGFFGDSSCNLATVKEPGFNVSGLGSGSNAISGLSIPESRAVIFNPNCKTDTYQAML